jgi:hypothetical protein
MPFQKNNEFSSGRPKNATNKIKSKESLNNLLELILIDLTTNYDLLNNSDKVKLLIGYKHFFGIPLESINDFKAIHFDFN